MFNFYTDESTNLNVLFKQVAPSDQSNSADQTWFETLGLKNAPFFCSPLSRTMQTGERVLAALPVPQVTVSELIRASIGTDVCNFRRSVHFPTSAMSLPPPFNTGCRIPNDSLESIYVNSKVNFTFNVRPPGGTGFGLISDNDQIWRSDFRDDTHILRSLAFLAEVFEYVSESVVGVVTHGEMINAIYEAVGEASYQPLNTEVVPIIIDVGSK